MTVTPAPHQPIRQLTFLRRFSRFPDTPWARGGTVINKRTANQSLVARKGGFVLLQSAALALLFIMALPAQAGDERAVKIRVAPVYPEIAKRMRIAGEVKLEATVDAGGSVTDV